MKFTIRLIISILFPLGCFAQFNVTGKVIDKTGARPVPNASVFINNTTFGDKTTDHGFFRLRNLKPGTYELVVSTIGFDTYKQTLVVSASDAKLPDIEIQPRVMALKEVTVKTSGNAYRDIYYNRFKDEFLGRSNLAQDCKILNPEILDFDYDDETKTLTASTPDFLEIENNALGYKLKYLLTNFKVSNNVADKEVHYEGSVIFVEMMGTVAQKNRWKQNREEIYEGSVLHFSRSVMNDELDENGFEVFRIPVFANPNRPPDSLVLSKIKLFETARLHASKDLVNPGDSLTFWKKKEKLLNLPKTIQALMPYPLNKQDIITLQNNMSALSCDNDALLVVYNKNHRFIETKRLADLNNLNYILNKADEKEVTLLNFTEPYALFNNTDSLINPNSLVFKGAWSRNRIADLLPSNYEPPENTASRSVMILKSDTILKNNITKLNSLSASRPVEKVYLHLDKPHYDRGDTIWFKAYTVIGEKHQLSALSGILYAELISPADSVIKRLTLRLISGTAWGDFALPRSYKPGTYHIRAYTNWMRNAGPDYFYNSSVQVGGMPVSLNVIQQAGAVNPDVQFFPEGGVLVNGVRSRVAVKSVGANGLGENIRGTIEDNEGNVVADFATQHLGMGVFALIPQSGKTYRAKITAPGETGFTVSLPGAMDEGYTLALDDRRKDSLYVKVAVSEKLFKEKQHTKFYLVAQSGGKIYYTAAGKLESPVFIAVVESSRFPTGVVQFTLFSDKGEPTNERIAFIQNSDTLKLNVTSNSTVYTTRQPIKINLGATDNISKPVTGSFSVAVINESRVGIDENAESTILSDLMLTSELRGNIEQPNYYFNNRSDQTAADLDVLMLTQGYRRFEWKQAPGNTPPAITFLPEKTLELAGVLKTPSGKPIPNGKVTLVATKENILRDTTTDINGNFKFDNLYLSDTSKIVLRARKQHDGSNVAIYVKQPEYPGILKGAQPAAASTLSPEIAAILQKNNVEYRRRQDSLQNGRQLREVVIKDKRQAKPDEFNRYGTMEERYIDMKTLKGFPSLENAIDGTQSALLLPFKGNRAAIDNIKVIIDGVPFHKKDLYAYDPNEIESVAVISGILPTDPPLLVVTTKRYAGTDRTILKEVKIKAGRIQKAPDLSRSSNLHGGGNADQVIMGDDLGTGCISISDCLIGKIKGVNFTASGIPVNTRGGRMSIIVDGNVLTGSHLDELVANDIYSIEVLRSGAARSIYGTSIESGGALVITMKHGGEDNKYNAVADTTILKQVDIKGKKIAKKPALANSANLNGPGHANQVIMGDQVQGCVKLSDCLNGKVAGVKFDLDGIPYSTRTGGRLGQGSGFGPPPMVTIVDGIVMNANFLNQINPNDIYSIEVLRSGGYLAIYGTNAPGGAFVITTRRGGETSFVTSETPAGLITYPFQGFYKARAFYSPKYAVAKSGIQSPDMRNTIYWNPNVITGQDGKASFEYSNNDTKGIYRVVIEGIDDNGYLGRLVYRYKVE